MGSSMQEQQVGHTWPDRHHPPQGVHQVTHQQALAVAPLPTVHVVGPGGVAGTEGLNVGRIISQRTDLRCNTLKPYSNIAIFLQ